jgi:hypothetical protein
MVTITPQALPTPTPGSSSPAPVITLNNPASALAILGGSNAVQVAVSASQPTSTGAILLLQVAGQTIEAKSPLNLKPGTTAELRLIPGTDPPKAQLVTGDTTRPATPTTQTPADSSGTGPARQTNPGSSTSVEIRGAVAATVLRAAAPAAAATTTIAGPAAAGTAATATTTVQTPGTATPPATPNAAGTAAATTGQPAASATVTAAATGTQSPATAGQPASGITATPLQTGATLTVRPLAEGVQPSAQAQQVINGTVIRTPGGATTLVNSPAGILSVNLPDAGKAGSTIRLEVLDIRPPAPTALPLSTTATTPGSGLGVALADALQAIARLNPQVATELATRLPQAGPAMAANLVRLVSAIRTGQPGAILTDPAMRLLERAGRSDLAGRVRDEAGASRRAVGEGGDWRSYQLPFLNGAEIEPVRLFMQYPENADGEPQLDDPVRRFLIDLDLSNIGQLQIDGLIGDKSLDLILRTDDELPQNFRDELNLIYIRSLEAIGRTGQLQFRPGEPPVVVDIPEHRDEGIFV